MADDILIGEFQLNNQTYQLTEDDYLQLSDDVLNSATIDEIINAAKHVAVQRQSRKNGDGVDALRGDYHFSQDPIEWEGAVLIFDANNLAWRCKHSYNLSFGQLDVSVTYGCLSVIASTIRKFDNVASVIMCWDGGVPQYRYDRIPGYKRRDHSDDEDYQDFLRQVRELHHDILPKLGVYSLRRANAEADDLIYHTSRLIHPDYHKIIVSTDQDLLQCINHHTSVWQPTKELLINRYNFLEYIGLKQSDFLVYRCMVGDSSDKVDGIKGIGEKTALKLIEDYGASPSNFVNIATNQSSTDKPMTPSVAEKIKTFGLKGFADTMAAIRLDHDMCGVRGYLLEALKHQCAYDHAAVNVCLKKYAFVSLMDTKFYDCFKNLVKPRLSYLPGDELRFPRVFNSDKQPI